MIVLIRFFISVEFVDVDCIVPKALTETFFCCHDTLINKTFSEENNNNNGNNNNDNNNIKDKNNNDNKGICCVFKVSSFVF